MEKHNSEMCSPETRGLLTPLVWLVLWCEGACRQLGNNSTWCSSPPLEALCDRCSVSASPFFTQSLYQPICLSGAHGRHREENVVSSRSIVRPSPGSDCCLNCQCVTIPWIDEGSTRLLALVLPSVFGACSSQMYHQ